MHSTLKNKTKAKKKCLVLVDIVAHPQCRTDLAAQLRLTNEAPENKKSRLLHYSTK